jgi:hypothetical protein
MEPRRGARQKLKPRRIVNYASQDGLQSTLTNQLRRQKVNLVQGH